jgi:hypothetical protein
VFRIGIDEFSIEINGLKGFFEGFRCRNGRVEVEGDDDSKVALIVIEAPQGIHDLESGKVGKVARVFRNDRKGIEDVCEAWNRSLRRSPEKVREKEDVELVRCASRICTGFLDD